MRREECSVPVCGERGAKKQSVAKAQGSSEGLIILSGHHNAGHLQSKRKELQTEGATGQGTWETWAGCLSLPSLPPSLGSLMLQAVAHFTQLVFVPCQGALLQEILDHFSYKPFPNTTE